MIDCLWIFTHICHTSYGRRHVVPSAVLLAGIYTPQAKLVLAGMYALPAPTGRQTIFCRYRQGKLVTKYYYRHVWILLNKNCSSLHNFNLSDLVHEKSADSRQNSRVGRWTCGPRLLLEPEGPGSSPQTTDFLTNSCGQATYALVFLFSVNWYQLASGWRWDTVCINVTQFHSGEHLMAVM